MEFYWIFNTWWLLDWEIFFVEKKNLSKLYANTFFIYRSFFLSFWLILEDWLTDWLFIFCVCLVYEVATFSVLSLSFFFYLPWVVLICGVWSNLIGLKLCFCGIVYNWFRKKSSLAHSYIILRDYKKKHIVLYFFKL